MRNEERIGNIWILNRSSNAFLKKYANKQLAHFGVRANNTKNACIYNAAINIPKNWLQKKWSHRNKNSFRLRFFKQKNVEAKVYTSDIDTNLTALVFRTYLARTAITHHLLWKFYATSYRLNVVYCTFTCVRKANFIDTSQKKKTVITCKFRIYRPQEKRTADER